MTVRPKRSYTPLPQILATLVCAVGAAGNHTQTSQLNQGRFSSSLHPQALPTPVVLARPPTHTSAQNVGGAVLQNPTEVPTQIPIEVRASVQTPTAMVQDVPVQPIVRDPVYHLPLDSEWLSLEQIRRPHHDHAAIDIPVPIGTKVYAARGGVAHYTHDHHCGWGLRVVADDGFEYVYCHGSRRDVTDGQNVVTGQLLMHSGETATRGFPHLHFGIRTRQRDLCPQDLLVAWSEGNMLVPSDTTSSTTCVFIPPHPHRQYTRWQY